MRFTLSLAIIALAAATPATAQNDMTNAGAAAQTNATDANAAMPVATDPTTAAATPGAQPATLPPDADAAAVDTAVTRDTGDGGDRDFPWGVIGLVGLIGLLGRRRSS